MILGLSLSYLENQEKSLFEYEKLITEKDAVLRVGALRILSLGFINSSSNKIIKILLDRIAKDLSDEVKKQAVFGLLFVLLPNPERCFSLL